jgi:hypothetical protein
MQLPRLLLVLLRRLCPAGSRTDLYNSKNLFLLVHSMCVMYNIFYGPEKLCFD